MKIIWLIGCLLVLGACSKVDDNFINNTRGEYTLDSDISQTVLVNNEGDIYINNIKTYDFEDAKDEFNAIYEHEITKMYFPFRLSGTKLLKGNAFNNESIVDFNTVVDYATKKIP